MVAWKDPQLHVVLLDFRESAGNVPGYLQRRTGIMWISPGFRGFDLNVEALEGIVNAARTSGLKLTSSIRTTSSGRRGVRQHEIVTQ